MLRRNMKRVIGTAALTAAAVSFATAGTAGAAVTTDSVTLTPTNLVFGPQQVGTASATKTMTLRVPCNALVTYTGGKICSSPGTVDSIAATGDFVQSNDCPLPIRNSSTSGAVVTCTITVGFAPTAAGERNGDITLTSNGVSGAYTAPLLGDGFVVTPTDPGTPGTPGTPSNPANGGGSKGQNGSGGNASAGGSGSVAPAKAAKCKGKKAKRKRCAKPRR